MVLLFWGNWSSYTLIPTYPLEIHLPHVAIDLLKLTDGASAPLTM